FLNFPQECTEGMSNQLGSGQVSIEVAGELAAMLVGGLLREKQTLVASLVGAGVALVLMALFFVYQKWRYDLATGHGPAA
ncbi:MAG: hypothetical protein L0191_02855, partial [Acidobacteria bacterium]|nr:hypothetical protein [Acidobacteriota bacterium]